MIRIATPAETPEDKAKFKPAWYNIAQNTEINMSVMNDTCGRGKKQTKGIITLVATRKSNYKKIENLVKTLHPFDTPCILELPIKNVLTKYKSWLYDETK